jgi:hypothetical protein
MSHVVYLRNIRNNKIITEKHVIPLDVFQQSPVVETGTALVRCVSLLKSKKSQITELINVITNVSWNTSLTTMIHCNIPNHASIYIDILDDLYNLGIDYKQAQSTQHKQAIQRDINAKITALEIAVLGGVTCGFLALKK